MIFGEDEVLSIPFKFLVLVVGGLPLSALAICIMLNLILHYREAVATHCEVPNWLPSVSAAVATFSPERYIWRVFIAIHGTPRLALAFAFKNFLVSSSLWPSPFKKWFRWVCNFACTLNLLEVLFLLMLTSISSSEDHFIHVTCFTLFASCGILYMLLSSWLFDYSGRRRATKLGEVSFQYKVLCCTGTSLSLLLALYFYYRHNRYCEPGIYTLFAIAEYAFIVFNVLFHSTLYYDFHSRILSLGTATSSSQYDLLPTHSYSEKRT